MIALIASTFIEGALILAISWAGVYTLRVSGVFADYVVTGINYYYPLTETQVYVLLVVLVTLIGVFLVFALGTKGIKWFIAPVLALCIPTLVAHSGLPSYLEQEYGMSLDLPILNSSMTLTSMLVMALALVAGFVVLYQMISLREMGDHLSWRGVDEADVNNAYKGRSVAIIAIVVVSVIASYFVSHYSSTMKGIFSENLSLSPLLYLLVGIGGGLVTIVIILMLLITQKPKERIVPQSEPKGFRQKAAAEAGAVLNTFVPKGVTRNVGRALGFVLRPVAMAGRLGLKKVKSSERLRFLRRNRDEDDF